jgi:hypothetical protein
MPLTFGSVAMLEMTLGALQPLPAQAFAFTEYIRMSICPSLAGWPCQTISLPSAVMVGSMPLSIGDRLVTLGPKAK